MISRGQFISTAAIAAAFIVGTVSLAQNTARFDPRDLTGIWSRVPRDGGPACRDCGERGFNADVPPMTPEGLALLNANKPGYGRPAGSADAAAHPEEHIGRRKAVAPALGNDPTGTCNPIGPTRMLLYIEPVEFILTKDRMIQHFEWANQWREIFIDGRPLLAEPDLPRWYGYSVGKWEGDEFVVETVGVDDRTWIDHFGYPHSAEMRLQERYRRVAPNRLELTMTITDPKIYTRPWISEKKAFILQNPEKLNLAEAGWKGLLDQTCAPIDEVENFNKRVRDPAGGVKER